MNTMEIVSLYGNVSLKDGRPFAHLHVVLPDEQGNGKGGHLVAGGAPVFACEVTIEEYSGPELVRNFDEQTGLFLWDTTTTL
jgi:predicted DNA-binding protein with PD1-like motif